MGWAETQRRTAHAFLETLANEHRHFEVRFAVYVKSQPRWHRNRSQWQQGIDVDTFAALRSEVEAGARVIIVVLEEQSPSDPLADSKLLDSGSWLFIDFRDAEQHGSADRSGSYSPLHCWPRKRMVDVCAATGSREHRRNRLGIALRDVLERPEQRTLFA